MGSNDYYLTSLILLEAPAKSVEESFYMTTIFYCKIVWRTGLLLAYYGASLVVPSYGVLSRSSYCQLQSSMMHDGLNEVGGVRTKKLITKKGIFTF